MANASLIKPPLSYLIKGVHIVAFSAICLDCLKLDSELLNLKNLSKLVLTHHNYHITNETTFVQNAFEFI